VTRGRPAAARVVRVVAAGLAAAALLAVLASLTAVLLGGDGSIPVVLLAALAAWTAPATAIALALLALARLRWAAIATLVLLVGVLGWLRPFPRGGPEPAGRTQRLTVLSQNLFFGQADARQVVATVRREHVDVLVLTELTPAALTALDAAGLAQVLPHRVADPRSGAGGTGLFAALPLRRGQAPVGTTFASVEAVADLGGRPLRLLGVHPAPPQLPTWQADHDLLRDALARPLAEGEPMVVLGDFNATRGNRPFRRLLDAGLADAAEQRAWAWQQQTWPAGGRLPPGIRIDHVLLSRPVAVDRVGTVRVAGTDHLGVLAVLTWA
jgi:endonuclease/exonuclease/phosphatase (EEP) superfamily protein YafD